MASFQLIEMVRRHEGVRAHLYRDSLGFWTVGVGHMVDVRKGGWCDDDIAARLNKNGFSLSPQVIDAYLREAHDQLLDSKWARQLPQRAKEIAEIILHGG